MNLAGGDTVLLEGEGPVEQHQPPLLRREHRQEIVPARPPPVCLMLAKWHRSLVCAGRGRYEDGHFDSFQEGIERSGHPSKIASVPLVLWH